MRYFVRDSFIDECMLDSSLAPRSLAFFCRTCGDIWARTIVNNGDDWDVLTAPCEQHPGRIPADSDRTPGSMLYWGLTEANSAMMWWAGVIDFLPRAVLEREFLLRTQ